MSDTPTPSGRPRRPILLGAAEAILDPRAGDVCTLRGQQGLWVPFGRPRHRTARELGALTFVRFPDGDPERDTVLAGVEDVEAIEHSHTSTLARDFWRLTFGDLRREA